jgi:thiol-disulfide isomerase/thioredoxin
MSRRRPGAIVLAVLLALGLLAGCSSAPPGSSVGLQEFAPSDRKAAPELTGDLLDGTGTYRLADHAGDVVVINFWGSWCAPCVAEADDLEGAYQATKDSKVSFLGINVNDDRDLAQGFVRGRVTYPSVFDPSGKLALGFAVAPSAVPATIVLDRDARIAAVVRGSVLREDLERVVVKLAAESS